MDIKNIYEYTDEDQRLLEEEIMRRREERREATRKRVFRSRMIGVSVIILIIIIVFICRSCAKSGGSKEKDSSSSKAVAANKDLSSAAPKQGNSGEDGSEDASAPDSGADSQADPELPPDDLSELRTQLNTAIDSYSGTWSVYVKNLDTGYSVSINNTQVYAASEIKLFAMASAYQQISEGLISEDNIYNTIYGMITYSSNDDFNSVVWKVGKYYITDWCSKNGYNDTIQCHGLHPASNANGLATTNGYNLTTVEDIGHLLESIYKGECISAEYSQKMLDIMLDQYYRSKIPAGVPENVKVANKTGETDDVCHDAAIVFSDKADYVLTVMVDAPGFGWSCNDNVAELSGIVYEYFNK